MTPTTETMGLTSMRDYVTGETSLTVLVAQLHRIPLDEARRILTTHRAELDSLNPARSVILESLVGA